MRALAGDQDPAVPSRGHEPAHGRLIGRIVKHQQPAPVQSSQDRVYRRDRITRVDHLPVTQLRGQLRQPGGQHRRFLRRDLPRHADLGQMPVRILNGQAGLAHPAHPAQHHDPQPRARGQQAVQAAQQVLAAGQHVRAQRQPHRQPRHRRPGGRVIRADRGAAMIGDHRARTGRSGDPEPG
jgi:hypothetical protein